MPELITVPTFIFPQGDLFDNDGNVERPIVVTYYDGSICLEQNGQEIIILTDYANPLFKEIKKHLPEASKRWESSK